MKLSLLFNAIAMCILATAVTIMGVRIFSDTLYASDIKGAGYPVDPNVAGGAAASGPELPPDWGTLFGDPAKLAELTAKGEKAAKVCASCHDFSPAHATKTGPGLHDVMGRKAGSLAGFAYSDGMKALGKPWSYDDLDHFLTSPKAYVAGTKMAFAGFPKQADRVAVIAYLHSISPAAPAIPAPDPTRDPAKAAEAAAAGGDKAAGDKAGEAAANATTAPAEAAANAVEAPKADAPKK